MRYKKIFWLILSVILVCFLYKNTTVSAKDINLLKNKTMHYEKISDMDSLYVPYCNCYYNITIENIKIQTEDGNITTEYNSYIKVWDLDSDKEYSYKEDKIILKKNGRSDKEDRRFSFELDAECPVLLFDYNIICDITVSLPSTSNMKLTKENITCYLDNIDGKSISIKNPCGTVKWSLSNTKVASIYRDGNTITIYPKKPGSCYLRAQCSGKTLKCKVKIKGRKKFYAGGILTSYDTRSNVFTMKFKNCSSKKTTILSRNIIVVDSDYSSFDRKLKINKAVTVKPGQEKKITFRVIGNYTWNNVNDFCINYSVKYRNKIYRIASDTEMTWIRKNGKWKELLTYEEIGYY